MKIKEVAKAIGLVGAGALAMAGKDVLISKDVFESNIKNAIVVKDSLRAEHWSVSKRTIPKVKDNDTTYETVYDSALVESKFNPFNARWANRGKFDEGERVLINVTEIRTDDTTNYGLDFTFAKDDASYILKVDEVQ